MYLITVPIIVITVDFRNCIVFFGPRPWHIEIRHRVKKTSTINLFGFETLKLKIRRLKLWKPTVLCICIYIYMCNKGGHTTTGHSAGVLLFSYSTKKKQKKTKRKQKYITVTVPNIHTYITYIHTVYVYIHTLHTSTLCMYVYIYIYIYSPGP